VLTAHRFTAWRGERQVFGPVSFSVGAGEALVLTGANGSGKSSLLRAIAGLLPRTDGELRWRNKAVLDDPEAYRGEIAFLGHSDAIKPALTAAENLSFWIPWSGGRASEIGAALARVGLQPLADLPARFLSAGQRRRLALARALAQPAALWLLDEPSNGLDRAAVAALEAALNAHLAAGGTLVLATHVPVALTKSSTLDLDASPDRS
jgi:heme exporter protein A